WSKSASDAAIRHGPTVHLPYDTDPVTIRRRSTGVSAALRQCQTIRHSLSDVAALAVADLTLETAQRRSLREPRAHVRAKRGSIGDPSAESHAPDRACAQARRGTQLKGVRPGALAGGHAVAR